MQPGALEIDVRLSKDRQLVLMHDARVNRTTNGRGKVSHYTVAELKQLDARADFEKGSAGTQIPTLAEVLALPRGDIGLIIELKDHGKLAGVAEQQLLAMLAAHKPEHIILKSFDREQLMRLRAAAPQYPQLYVMVGHFPGLNLTIAGSPSFHDPLQEPVEWLQWHRWFVSRERIDAAHAAGKRVVAWSVNDDDDIREMIALGVDGIETDRPDRVRELWLLSKPQN